MHVDLEGSKAVRVGLEVGGAICPGAGIGEIALWAVRIERDVVAELPAQQLVDGLAEQLAGEIPQRHVDAREHLHFAAALREDGEHVVVVDADGQRVLADQPQMRQAAAAGGVGGDGGAHMRAVDVTAFAIAGDTGIGIDADEAEAAVEPHGVDVGNGGERPALAAA